MRRAAALAACLLIFPGWPLLSWAEVMIHTLDPAPIYSTFNLFALLCRLSH